ncbi:hypothetical protein D4S03_02430, partial [bacterium]
SGTISEISTTTNANDTVAVTLTGGSENDWDVNDAYLIASQGQGRIKCPLVDVVNHRYLVACHWMKSIGEIYIPSVLPNAFNADGTQMTADDVPDPTVEHDEDGWTYLKFIPDVENPDFDYSVTCDGDGIESSVPAIQPGSKIYSGDGTGTLLTTPVPALMQYLILAGANLATDYDTTSYNAVSAAQVADGRVVSGIIDQEGWTHKDVIEQFMTGFSFQIFYNASGKLKFADYKVEAVVGGESSINDQDHVLENSLAIFQNQDVINSTTLHFGWNSVDGQFQQEPEALENLTSKANLGSTFSEDLQLYLVSDPKVATQVANNRMYYSDEDRYQVRFQIGAPEAPGTLDLCTNLLLTHFAGLSSERQTNPPKTTETTGDPPVTKTYGWVDELLRVTQLDYQLNGTPIITVVCLTMDPDENAYDFGSVPANVVLGSVTESAAGVITETWTLPGANDPTWVNVYYRRSEDKLSAKRFAGRVAASALTKSFTPDFEFSNSLDVYLVPEDEHGVIRELKWTIDATKDTTLAETIDLTEVGFDVASIADITAGDLILCDNEINKVLSKSGSTLTLYADAGVRLCYEDTAHATHASSAPVGTIKPTVTYGTLSVRTALSTPQNLTALFGETWITLGWDAYTDPNDVSMLRKYLVYRNTLNDFSSATCLNDGDTLTDNSYVDTDLTEPTADEDWPLYFYWVVGVNKSGVHSTNSTVSNAYGVSPTFMMVPPVTALAFTEEGTVMVDGTSKSRVGVVFTEPTAVADPGGLWRAVHIMKSPQLVAGNTTATSQTVNSGAPNPNWNEVARLEGEGHIYLDPDENKVILAAVSEGASPNPPYFKVGLTDQYYTDAAKVAGQQSDVALANAGKLAQGFMVKTSRTVGRFEVFLTLLGTLTTGATVTLSVFSNSAGAPNAALSNGVSAAVKATEITTTGGWVQFDFLAGVALTANTQYWLVLEPAGTYAAEADGSNQIQWGVDATDSGYSLGNWSVYAGSWIANTEVDGLFRACSYLYPRAALELTGKLAVSVPVVQTFNVEIAPRTTTTSESNVGGPSGGVFFATWEPPTGITTNEISHYVLNYSLDIGFDAAVDFNSNPTKVPGDVTHQEAYMPGMTYYWAIKCVLKNGDESDWIYLMDDAPINTQASPHVRVPVTAYKLAIKRADQAADVGVILDVNNAVVGIDLRGITINTIGQTESGARMMLNQNGLLAFNSTSTNNSTGKTVLVDATNGSFEFGDISNPSGNKITYNAATGVLTISGTQTGGSSSTDITGGTIGGIAISGSAIYSTNFSAGSAGFQIKSDGTAEFQAVTIRAAGTPSATSSLIYCGVNTGDYATARYGIFMNSIAISGRRNATVNGYHPNVFILAADTYAGDAVLPPLAAGDFILADDCKVAGVVETETSSNYFLKLMSGVLSIKAKINIKGPSTFDGAVTLTAGSSLSSGQTAYDTGSGFWIENTAGVSKFSFGKATGSKITYSTATEVLTISGSVAITSGSMVGWTITGTTLTGTNVVLDSAGTVKVGSTTNVCGMTAGSGFWAGAAAYAITDPFAVSVDGKLYANSVTIRANGNFGVASGTIYAGDISGASATNDWYGTFMSDKGITGRRVVAGVDTKNPLVFLLGSNDFTNLGDTVWPSFLAGDFVIADDVYQAIQAGGGTSAAYLKMKFDGAGAATLTVKGSLQVIGTSTFAGTITSTATITGGTIRTSASNPKIQMDTDKLVGYDASGNATFILTNSAITDWDGTTMDIPAGYFGCKGATIGGWNITVASPYILDGGSVGILQAGTVRNDATGTKYQLDDTNGIVTKKGNIAGWAFDSTTLSNASSNIVLTSGTVDQANITVGAGATAGGISAADAAGEIIIWGGSAWANRATAVFRVTAGGALTATSAEITGAISGSTIATTTMTGGTIQTATSPNARVILDSSGLAIYDSGNVQRAKLGADGSGWLGASNVLSWTTAGFTTLSGFTSNSTGLTVASGGNTTIVSSGATAFTAGPTGAPTFYVTQAGIMTAVGATLKSTTSGGRIEIDSAKIVGYDEDGTTVNFALAASTQTISGYTINPGDIWARTGYLGGWTISLAGLSSGADSTYVRITSDPADDYFVWAGAATAANAKFKVKKDGTVYVYNSANGGRATLDVYGSGGNSGTQFVIDNATQVSTQVELYGYAAASNVACGTLNLTGYSNLIQLSALHTATHDFIQIAVLPHSGHGTWTVGYDSDYDSILSMKLSGGTFNIYDSSGTSYFGFKAPANYASTQLVTLPADTPAANEFLKVTSNTGGAVVTEWAALSSTATGLTYTAATGAFSLTSGYVIPTTTQETNWGTAYTHVSAATGAEHGAAVANTANMIVRRGASGEFTAGTITANLTGNCSGSSGSCTGNAATSSSCSGNAAGLSAVLALASGGSNANLTAVQGGLVWCGASALAISAASTSGYFVRSGGTGAPTFLNLFGTWNTWTSAQDIIAALTVSYGLSNYNGLRVWGGSAQTSDILKVSNYNGAADLFTVSPNGNITTGSGTADTAAYLKVGALNTGNRDVAIDLHASSPSNYSLRLARSAGANAAAILSQTGTTGLYLRCENASANHVFDEVAGTARVTMSTTGTTIHGILDWSANASKPKIYLQDTEPTLPDNTCAFWKDTNDFKFYLCAKIDGTQVIVEMT